MSGQLPPPDVCVVGEWEPPFTHDVTGFNPPPVLKTGLNHKFESVHMALIPRGPEAGNVIVWDDQPANPPVKQRWSIVRPVLRTMQNRELVMPAGKGDLFCAGHAWTKDGSLFVVGGTRQYAVDNPPLPWIGGRLAYIWDPTQVNDQTAKFGWNLQVQDMVADRWYPTVTMDANDKLIVTGGVGTFPTLQNNYEAFAVSPTDPRAGSWDADPNSVRLYSGPLSGSGSTFSLYPRVHLLSTGEVFTSGHGPDSSKVLHNPAINPPMWDYSSGDDPLGPYRHDGSSVLFPIELDPALGPSKDVVYRMGGEELPPSTTIHDSVQGCSATTPASAWAVLPAMNHKRTHVNTVLLPDGSILAIGGAGPTASEFPLTAELYKNGQWIDVAATASPRDYHSTAVLLPSGKVFVGGGDNRNWDYEVYSPPYIFCGTRPVITTPPPGTMFHGLSYSLSFSPLPTVPPTSIQRVVLMRAGSVTHHSCMDQRYVSLELTRPVVGTSVTFKAPATRALAPRGYYMLFLVDNHGIPSEAAWVQLQ